MGSVTTSKEAVVCQALTGGEGESKWRLGHPLHTVSSELNYFGNWVNVGQYSITQHDADTDTSGESTYHLHFQACCRDMKIRRELDAPPPCIPTYACTLSGLRRVGKLGSCFGAHRMMSQKRPSATLPKRERGESERVLNDQAFVAATTDSNMEGALPNNSTRHPP